MRSNHVNIRITDEEKQMLDELVIKEERTVSDVMRRLLREEWKKMALKELRKK